MNEDFKGPARSRVGHSAVGRSMPEELHLASYAVRLYRRRTLLVGIWVLATTSVFLINAFVLTPRYQSTATVLAPETQSTGLISAVQANALPGPLSSLAGFSLNPEADLFEAILKSDRVARALVAKYDLLRHYDLQHLEDAVDELKRDTKIVSGIDNVIAVKVVATRPQLAADLANSYVDELDRVLNDYRTTEAGWEGRFVSEQIQVKRRELETAEESLREFQEANNLIAIEEQASGGAAAIRYLRMEISYLDARINVLRNELSSTNPELRRMECLLSEMKTQLANLEFGTQEPESALVRDGKDSNAPEELFVPIASFPHLGLQVTRMLRDVVMKEKVYALLLQELEKSRIAEARKLPSVRKLDEAVPAARRSSPRPMLNTFIAAISSLVIAVFIGLGLDALRGFRKQFNLAKRLSFDNSGPSETQVESFTPPLEDKTAVVAKHRRAKRRKRSTTSLG